MTTALRWTLGLALGLATACGGDDGDRLGFADVNGTWTFTFTRTTTTCGIVVASPANLYLQINFTGDAGGAANVLSTWSNSSQELNRWTLMGSTSSGLSGPVELRMWTNVQATGILVQGSFARSGDALTFTGTALDPIPGFRPYLSTASCQYSVTGRKSGT